MTLRPLEIKTAKNWYLWLWFSPVFTIPTLLFMENFRRDLRNLICPDYSCPRFLQHTLPYIIIVLLSACLHLILLVPALDKESSFVRWHGRQALLLAGIRTMIALWAVLSNDLDVLLLAIPLLIIIWLVGNISGTKQASRGQCSLMTWFGHPIPPIAIEHPNNNELAPSSDPDLLVETFRFSPDSQKRKNALEELKRLGLVEPFGNE